MSALPIDHIAVAVESIELAAPHYELLSGERCSPVEEIPSQGVNVAWVGGVELLEPLGSDTPVGRFLQRRGPGLHHLAYRVPDLAAELARLGEAGVDLIDRAPRRGARGHEVAFVHPRSTGGVLVELVQHDDAISGPR